MFLLLRLVWMSLLIYAAAIAFTHIMNVDQSWSPAIVVVIGVVSLTYSALGGLRAVVVTDLLQTILLYGGALLVIVLITLHMDGFGWMPHQWQTHWDTQPIFTFDPGVRISVVGSILSVLIWNIATSGGDQVSVQRFMATEDESAARKALGIQYIINVIVGVTLGLAGLAMLGFFQANPDLLPVDFSIRDDADGVFPRFIAFHLPPVVSGLVASGMLAAAMSSIDSGINSITAVVTTDFVDRFASNRSKEMTERGHVRLARWVAVAVGAIVVVGSSLVSSVPGNILGVTMKTVNLLTVPIFGLFFFALFVKRASIRGVWIGCLCGTLAAAGVAFSGPITGAETDPISFQWINPVALVVNLVVGYTASIILPDKPDRNLK
jgi:SSS family solute:Na+ symporter